MHQPGLTSLVRYDLFHDEFVIASQGCYSLRRQKYPADPDKKAWITHQAIQALRKIRAGGKLLHRPPRRPGLSEYSIKITADQACIAVCKPLAPCREWGFDDMTVDACSRRHAIARREQRQGHGQ